jgi:hypothetical protein
VPCALCALAFMAWAPARALAQDRVDVPEGCGSERELRAELLRLLGPEGAQAALPERLQISRAGEGDYALSLELAGESRTMRDADCRALFKTAVVVAAAIVSPHKNEAPPRSASSVPLDEAPPPTAQDVSAPPPRASQARSEPERAGPAATWRGSAAIGAGGMISLLPQLAAMFELSGTLGYGDVGLALGARYLMPSEAQAGGARSVSIYGLGGRLLGFYEPADWVRLHAGIAADRLTGEGSGEALLQASDSGAAVAVALEAEAVPARFGDLRISIGIAAHYALVRPSFEIAGFGPLYRVPAAGGSAIVRGAWELR